jgi:hypothetical protein
MPVKIKVNTDKQRAIGTFKPATVDVEKRTVEVVFTTGQSGRRYDELTDTEYMEELDVSRNSILTERLDKGLSVIDSHRRYDGIDGVFGITEGYEIDETAHELRGVVRFASDPVSDVKFQKVREGILRHVSLGYSVFEYTPQLREEKGLPVYMATRWSPNELSFVPVSFETNNGVVRNDPNPEFFEIKVKEEIPMTIEQIKAALAAAKTRSAPEAEINDLQRQLDTALASAAPVVPPVVAPVVAETRAAPAPVVAPTVTPDPAQVRQQERAQLQPMLDACRSAGLKEEFAITAYNAGTSVDNFRAQVISELGNKDSQNVVRVGTVLNSDDRADQAEQTRIFAEQSLIHRSGGVVEMTDGIRGFATMTLWDMAREFVEASGVNTRMMSRQKVAERAFHSTSTFPLILENVMNKNLQAAYTETPQTFRDLGQRTTVNDFRDKHTYSLGDAPNLLPLGEHGEYKAGTFSEGKEKYGIATYARKIGFTRKMIINDDMSALDRVPRMFGAAGSRLESNIVWGLILNYDFFTNAATSIVMEDGKALFHADHGNLLTSGSAFSETALSEMRKLGRKVKTLDGNFMNLTYNQLVIPEDIETAVEKILVQNIMAAVTGNTNPFQGKMQHRVEPRLGVVSQTAYYAFSNMADTFEYAYLAGEEEMMTETNTQTDIDGMEVKVRKDFGAGLVDYRGMVKATGAA